MSVSGSLSTAVSMGRLHIVAIAALGTLTFGWMFTGRYLWLMAGVCAVDWFVVNLLNRVVDLKEDAANGIPGTAFVARHRRAIFLVGLGLLLSTVAATHVAYPSLTPLRLAYHALGFAYNWRLVPWVPRLKELYFWKNTASATGFMLTVFGYSLAAARWRPGVAHLAPGVTTATILVSGAFFFLFELSYEVVYDLRDAPGDSLAGVRTYPVVHGQAAAVNIIDGLLLASSAILLAGYFAGVIPWRMVVMLLAPLAQVLLYKRAYKRGITSADCVHITWLGAGLLLAYHLWIAAGLPGVNA